VSQVDCQTLSLPRQPRFGLRRATPATEHYERGVGLEAVDPAAAICAYERAVAGRPDFADAHNNLGRVLHDQHQLARAEAHYRLALCSDAKVALYHFNLGVVVEDQHRTAEAIAHYEHALALDPHLAAAHYNLARIFEREARRAGDDVLLRRALRHLGTYRSLARTTA
jgi:tetratricopeptide (TPR) repeat protein